MRSPEYFPTALRLAAEWRLLLACVRRQPLAQSGVDLAALDWTRLLQLATNHDLLAALGPYLVDAQPVPAAVRALLWAQYQSGASRNQALAAETAAVVTALQAAGITAVPYKGVALAAACWPDLAWRTVGDVDVIVPPTAVSAALPVLQQSGYRPAYELTPTQQSLLLRVGCERHFEHSTRPILLELHWRFLPPYLGFSLDLAQMLRRLAQVRLGDTAVPAFSTADTLLLLCLHGYKHQWSSLKWICDVAYLLQTAVDLDWTFVWRQAQAQQATRLLLLGLALAQQLLHAPLPSLMQQRIAADRRVAWLQQVALQRIVQREAIPNTTIPIIYTLRAAERWSKGMRILLRRLLLLNQNDITCWRLPSGLIWLYYGPRLLRLGRATGQRLRRLWLPNRSSLW